MAMTFSSGGTTDDLDQALMMLLAKTNRHMTTLWKMLYENPAVSNATGACDIMRLQHPTNQDEEEYWFDAYVEAETRAGITFCWSLDLVRGSSGWTVHRHVSKQAEHGAESAIEFEEVSFKNLDELAGGHAALMTEFVKSADNFDFGL
jgi:hypothetical protein